MIRISLSLIIVIALSFQISCSAANVEDNTLPSLNINLFRGLGASKPLMGPDLQIDLSEYLVKLRKVVRDHWNIPQDISKPAEVTFKAYNNGDICDVLLASSSSNKEMDQSAIDAVVNCRHLPFLPTYSPQYIILKFRFDQAFAETKIDSNKIDGPMVIGFGRNSAQLAQEYFNTLCLKIKSYWYPPKDGGNLPSVTFVLHKDGNISDLKIVQTGIESHNKAAINAVQHAAPFMSFRPEWEDAYTINLDFRY